MKRSPSSSALPGGPPGMLVAVVVEDLGARAAGAGVAHAPEIVRGWDADDAVVGQAGDGFPDRGGLIVFGEDGDQQAVFRQAELLGDQVPGVGNGGRLEVVAEGEIAEHLEEGVVPRGVADVVEVVVLAAGADAFLRRGGADVGALFLAGEDVLELHHAGIGEHQRGVVARHERRAFHHGMAVAGEVVEEGGADVVAAGHGGLVGFLGWWVEGQELARGRAGVHARHKRGTETAWPTRAVRRIADLSSFAL